MSDNKDQIIEDLMKKFEVVEKVLFDITQENEKLHGVIDTIQAHIDKAVILNTMYTYELNLIEKAIRKTK